MKICVRCKTENNADYKYCRLCGAELPCVDKKPVWENSEPANNEQDKFENGDEISTYEMNVFVGKNSNAIVPKFIQLQREDKKVAFCLPVFLLGLFCGIFGVAAYFLYRKMTKLGSIFLAVAILLVAVETVVNFDATYQYVQSSLEVMNEAVQNGMSAEDMSAKLGELERVYQDKIPVALSIINEYIVSLAVPIIIALFTIYLYKEHSISKISECKAEGLAKTEYLLALHRKGGTSAGAVVVGVAIYLVIAVAIAAAPVVMVILGG